MKFTVSLHRGCADRGGDCARTDGNGRAKPGYDRRQLGRGSDRSHRGSAVVHEPGGTQNECQSPGNAQIYDAPPQVDYFPYAGGAT